MHNTWSLVKRHLLIVNNYNDVKLVTSRALDRVEYVVFEGEVSVCDTRFRVKKLHTRDEMRDFRRKFKIEFNVAYMGHIFTLYVRPATYDLLNEWLVYDVNELDRLSLEHVVHLDPPHVVVFDMDSTLITDEEEVRIRDPAIYEALDELKALNCVLCLWSYGDREHVVHSLNKLELSSYFDIILSEGRRIGEYSVAAAEDRRYDVFYKSTPFYLDVTDVKHIPKSPRVVLWYLQKYNVGYIKTITLVDDLSDNNISYDNFVNPNTCPVPVDDWDNWHRRIVRFIKDQDSKWT